MYDCFVICRGGVVDFCIAQKKKSKDKAAVLLFLYSKGSRMVSWEPYLNEKDQDGRFHFAIAILGGILLCAGGVY